MHTARARALGTAAQLPVEATVQQRRPYPGWQDEGPVAADHARKLHVVVAFLGRHVLEGRHPNSSSYASIPSAHASIAAPTPPGSAPMYGAISGRPRNSSLGRLHTSGAM